MSLIRIFAILVIFLLQSAILTTQTNGQSHSHTMNSDQKLLERLRAGGNIIFFRHERTNMLIQDAKNMTLANCTTQRNLSITGIAAARENGRYIRELGIPINAVRASPMCRTIETARHAFERVKAEPRLMGANRRTGRDRSTVGSDLRKLVPEFVVDSSNSVFVAHFSNIEEAFAIRLFEGDAAIISMEDKKPVVIGVIRANQWSDLVFAKIREQQAAGSDQTGHKHGHSLATEDE